MDDGRETPLDRTRRAKTEQKAADRSTLDGGAVAAGMVATLVPQIAPGILLAASLPTAFVAAAGALTALGVPLGGYVAGWLAGSDRRRGAIHGSLAVSASIFAVGTVSLSLVGGDLVDPFRAGLFFALVALLAVSVGGLVGGVTGYVGGRRRARAE